MEVMTMRVEETEKHYIMKVGSLYVRHFDLTQVFGLSSLILSNKDSAYRFHGEGAEHNMPHKVISLFRALQKEGMQDITIACIEEKFTKEETEFAINDIGTSDAGTITADSISDDMLKKGIDHIQKYYNEVVIGNKDDSDES